MLITINWNQPGYLPDNDAYAAEDASEAAICAIEMAESFDMEDIPDEEELTLEIQEMINLVEKESEYEIYTLTNNKVAVFVTVTRY